MLELQVRLDRAGFSPGEIDARSGPNTDRAWTAFAASRGLPPTTADVASKLEAIRAGDRAEPLISYTLTDADVAGPFGPAVPTDLMKQSELPALRFTSVAEALGEKIPLHAGAVDGAQPWNQFPRRRGVARAESGVAGRCAAVGDHGGRVTIGIDADGQRRNR
jgi:peptidoglycan hydrolase-like protein with peptidoglycan-binding domain